MDSTLPRAFEGWGVPGRWLGFRLPLDSNWLPPNFDSGLIRRCTRHWSVPVCDLTNAAFSTYLRPEIAILIVLPEGRRRLQSSFTDGTELHLEELAHAVNAAEERLAG